MVAEGEGVLTVVVVAMAPGMLSRSVTVTVVSDSISADGTSVTLC